MDSVYLDIETRSFPGKTHYITVVGFYHRETGLVQLVNHEQAGRHESVLPGLTSDFLAALLPGAERVYTYNGNSFDLKVIKQHLGLDLLERATRAATSCTTVGPGG